MKLEDLKTGQIIELRWEYWDHNKDGFEPRVIHMVLLHRAIKEDVLKRAKGWRATVIYDSNPKERGEMDIPYDNTYYDTWLRMSISEDKLTILSDTANEV
jgi:hypothetical protein